MASLNPQKVLELKAFVSMCQKDPTILHRPDLAFFKDYLESLNAEIPGGGGGGETSGDSSVSGPRAEDVQEESEASEPEESFDEASLNDSEVIPPETDEPPPLAPAGEKDLSDEELSRQGKLKEDASAACEAGDLPAALNCYTEALEIGNPTALLYTRRADVLLKLRRPVACIRDCDEALKLNPDNARAYKTRGKANRYLGRWREAHHDMDVGQKLDYDEGLWDMQKIVDEKYKVIQEHDRKSERKREKKEKKRREREIKKRREAAQRAYEEQKKREAAGCNIPGGVGSMPGGFPTGSGGGFGFPGGMPAGFSPGKFGTQAAPGGDSCCGGPGKSCGMPGGGLGGFGGMPAGGGAGGLGNLLGAFNDPNTKKIFENPKMMEAFQDIMSNPSSISKYANDPEIMAAFGNLTSKFGGAAAPGATFPQ